jgi:anti-sigma factor RsiW
VTRGAGSELTCAELVELVTDYLDDALDPEARAAFEQHLGGCEGCVRYLAQVEETIRRLGSAAPERLPPHARDRLLAAFRGWPRSFRNGSSRRLE